MACAGLKGCEVGLPLTVRAVEKTRRIINLAFEMQRYAKQQRWGEGNRLQIKIGIHYGRVIAGVIGTKPQFSLIGDTVNTTSRVCSTGE